MYFFKSQEKDFAFFSTVSLYGTNISSDYIEIGLDETQIYCYIHKSVIEVEKPLTFAAMKKHFLSRE